MAKRKYRVVGIKPPGTVDLYPFGVVDLYDCDDARLKEILDQTHSRFIEPAPNAPEPTQAILVEKRVGKKSPKNE